MEYKKLKRNSFNIHLINTDRFKAINLDIFFSKKVQKEDISFSNLLCNMFVYSSKKYDTKNKLSIKLEELYSTKINSSYGINGNIQYINFGIEFLNPKYTEDFMYDESIELLKEIIFHPNAHNNEFENKTFELCKNNVVTQIKMLKINSFLKSKLKYKNIMFENTPSAYSSLGNEIDYEKITPKKLFEFYKKLFQDYKLDIFILGELTNEIENYIINEIDKLFKNLNNKNLVLSPFINYKISSRVKEIIETDDFKQSQLYVGYRIKNISKYELYYVINLYNVILGKINNSILFEKLRGENSLCYFITSSAYVYNTSINIESGINKVNYEKAVKLIKESIEDMKNEEKIKPLFEVALKTLNTIINDFYDDAYEIIDFYYKSEFEALDSIEEKREKLLNVSIKDIIALAKKLQLSTIYFLEGKSEE